MDIELGQVLSQIIAFLIMFWILKKFAWKPMTQFMEDRRKLIQDEFNAIASQKDNIKEMMERYKEKVASIEEEARKKYQEEIARGNKAAQEITADAQIHAQKIIKNAKEEMEKELYLAKKDLKNYIVNLVMVTSEKFLQEKLSDEEKQKALIEKLITQTEMK
jgi:F-type H+-transporting ATPase subunit b